MTFCVVNRSGVFGPYGTLSTCDRGGRETWFSFHPDGAAAVGAARGPANASA